MAHPHNELQFNIYKKIIMMCSKKRSLVCKGKDKTRCQAVGKYIVLLIILPSLFILVYLVPEPITHLITECKS